MIDDNFINDAMQEIKFDVYIIVFLKYIYIRITCVYIGCST